MNNCEKAFLHIENPNENEPLALCIYLRMKIVFGMMSQENINDPWERK